MFWLRVYGRENVPKGEGRFLAQADEIRIEDLRGSLLSESKAGFKLRTDPPDAPVHAYSSTFEVARAVAAAWNDGGTEAVAAVIADAEREPTDQHLWAVIGELVARLPASDPAAKALTAVQRNNVAVANLVARHAAQHAEGVQLSLTDFPEGDS